MNNTDTHILCEPYEVEENLEREKIDITDFVEKSAELFKSINNINYEKIGDFKELDRETQRSVMSIPIPKSFTNTIISKIKQFSNNLDLSQLIFSLNQLMKKIDDLSSISDSEEITKCINEIYEYLIEYRKGPTYNIAIEKFGDVASFEDAIAVCENTVYDKLFEWLSEFPSRLISEGIDRIGMDVDTSKVVAISQKGYITKGVDYEERDETEYNRKELLYSIYFLYKHIINSIIECKSFWNKFFDLIDPDIHVDIDEEIFGSDDHLEMILNDLSNTIDCDDDIDEEIDQLMFGSEANLPGAKDFNNKGPNPFKLIANFYKTFPSKINKIRKRFKMYRVNAKNHAFYMKYIGRIEGLYERYADETEVVENGMKGDPVEVLKNSGHKYISDVSNNIVNLQFALIDLSKKFASMNNPKMMYEAMKRFGGLYMSEIKKSSDISPNFKKSLQFKFGEIINKNNKIYGYTPQGIAENKKIPPSNHCVVSLFVDRADEKPFTQKVSDIFKSVKSFQLIAKNEKEPILEVTMICSDILTKGIQEESFKQLKENKKTCKENVLSSIKEITAKEEKPKKAKRELLQQYKYCWKALEEGYKDTLEMKKYVAELIESYFVMMTRIDNLCKICLTALLQTERNAKDGGFKTGFDADKKKSNKEYKQVDEETEGLKTEGEKEDAKLEDSEKRKAIKKHSETIKKAMRSSRW
ncbi:MAG: hypothetical protein ACRC5M_04605 [Anaeroplasmataceae bacterium]